MPSPRAALAPCLLVSLLSLAARGQAPARGLEADLPAAPGPTCQTPDAIRLERAAALVRKAYLPLQPATKTIAGLKLTDDARALAVLERVLGKTPPASLAKAKDCANVLCVLRKTLDDKLESALWILAIGAEADGVPSLDQALNRGAAEVLWKPEELRILGKSILDLPPRLRRGTNWKVTRRMPDGANWFQSANAWSSRSDEGGEPGGGIWLRDTVWKLPQHQLRELVAHEAAHQLEYGQAKKDAVFPISHSARWLILSGWEKVGDPQRKEAYKLPRYGPDTDSTTEPAYASEEFADAVADYRYRPRLMRAYSRGKYDFIKKLLEVEYDDVPADPPLDALMKRLGGPLVAISQCSASIQRAFRMPFAPQALLYTVRWNRNGTSAWQTLWRSVFVQKTPCLDQIIGTMQAAPEWQKLVCRADPDDLAQEVAERLEDVWGAFTEATGLIEATLPPRNSELCASKGDLTLACLAGPRGWELALGQARKLLKAYDRPRDSAEVLAHQLAAQVVTLPPDEELFVRWPFLQDPRELVTACLLGAAEISPSPGKDDWRFWVKTPPRNDVRPFASVLAPASTGCARDYAAMLKLRGLTLDPNEPLLDHFLYLLRAPAAPLEARFNADVLGQWRALATSCNLPPGGRASAADPDCVTAWLLPRLKPIAANGMDAQLAATLAKTLRGP
ncbi:MAG: hypothetical protein JST92_15300 [Deltaproteobacteria bacterium]|nr:hypothetical protein [Deltaproteobacteria bacterium]